MEGDGTGACEIGWLLDFGQMSSICFPAGGAGTDWELTMSITLFALLRPNSPCQFLLFGWFFLLFLLPKSFQKGGWRWRHFLRLHIRDRPLLPLVLFMLLLLFVVALWVVAVVLVAVGFLIVVAFVVACVTSVLVVAAVLLVN